jgi:riboflavin synthase
MFTGIVEEVGVVWAVAGIPGGIRITVAARAVLEELAIGDSIDLDGVCQTVVHRSADRFAVEAVGETLQKTTLGGWRAGRRVNLERALKTGGRLGGHIVQGHVNGTGRILARRPGGEHFLLEVRLPEELRRYVVEEGSIAVDGVSLTVARLRGPRVGIRVVPHTAAHTTLGAKRTGEPVNIEVDVLARYAERLPPAAGGRQSMEEKLTRWGYS